MKQLLSLYDPSSTETGKCLQSVYSLILAFKKSLSLLVCSTKTVFFNLIEAMQTKKFATSQRFVDLDDYWDEVDKERTILQKKDVKKQK